MKFFEGSDIATCPVNSFRRYLREVEKFPVEADHYVFRALYKFKLGQRLVSVNKPFSLKDIVPDISLFSTHSLRAGGSSAAANAGVLDKVFQRHGRWKSVSAKNGYVDDNLSSRLSKKS